MKKTIYLIILILFISCDNGKKTDNQLAIEIKREAASANAQKIMTEDFYYNVTDEFSPFGNDVGNDTFYLYREWRANNPDEDAKYFLNKTMKELNFSDFNLNTSSNDKQKLINDVDKMSNQYIDLNWIDNTVISLAFTQLFLEGKVDKDVKELAKLAIEREFLFVEFWKNDARIREERLYKLLDDLKKI
ncbi:hypothetical protein NAL32_20495 [Chryseobacterium sp. Ch-15]|uniref:Lipoprotein n=1 Tax=Chryseobacterium muglaense TaxID=2893752 RepID=A0A9Q3YSX9_9FLAO|nr:hypothetical protein [Chryseobacterium muglaense]MBD3907097.1 hypothetical protein [Chryseobacterium muglaense]MCC9036546.1 hypothetical protein [Chryseobacterium muglaense]MCM2556774.1 hypothetical protein [Chryseobacterium muglaense]